MSDRDTPECNMSTPSDWLQFTLWILLGSATLAYLWLKGTGMGPRI